MTDLKNFLNSDSGATVVEYVLIAAGIALAILAAVFAFGDDLALTFDRLSEATQS